MSGAVCVGRPGDTGIKQQRLHGQGPEASLTASTLTATGVQPNLSAL